MRTRSPFLAATLFLALPLPVDGQELPVLGQGNLTCSSWLDRRAAAAPEADTMIAWVLGYITAFNQYAGDPQADVTGGQELPELATRLDQYCEENASANLYQASAALVEELRRNPAQ